jgi:hypothetical protein
MEELLELEKTLLKKGQECFVLNNNKIVRTNILDVEINKRNGVIHVYYTMLVTGYNEECPRGFRPESVFATTEECYEYLFNNIVDYTEQRNIIKQENIREHDAFHALV